MEIRDRIKEFVRMSVRGLQDNDGNWRVHPLAQREGLAGVLDEVGIADALTAYYSERAGGALVLIDGHLRKEDYPDATWPVQILDVNDAEADILLASLDPLAMMAETNAEKLAELQSGIEAKSSQLKQMLEAKQAEIDFELQIKAAMGSSQGSGERRVRNLGQGKVKIRPVLMVDQIDIFERAISATGLPNRGLAIIEICQAYLDAKGQ